MTFLRSVSSEFPGVLEVELIRRLSLINFLLLRSKQPSFTPPRTSFETLPTPRGLLPDENFIDKVVLVPNPDPLHAPSASTPAELAALAEGSQPPPASQFGKTATGLKVKSLIRGYS